MDKLEYIPGDLVMVKKSALQFAKDKTFRVISSLSGGFVKVVMLNDSSTTYSISNNSVRPIPLTSEILEKNGWFEDSFLDNYKSFYKNDRNYPSLHGQQTKDGYIYDVDFGEETIITNIKYVHQLQHLLFGLGLNHEMEV